MDAGEARTSALTGSQAAGRPRCTWSMIEHVLAAGTAGHRADPGDRPDLPDGACGSYTPVRGPGLHHQLPALARASGTTSSQRAQARGEIDIMIGPRSALFTPFSQAWGSSSSTRSTRGLTRARLSPRYHAREVAGHAGQHGQATAGLRLRHSVRGEPMIRRRQGEYRLLTADTAGPKRTAAWLQGPCGGPAGGAARGKPVHVQPEA